MLLIMICYLSATYFLVALYCLFPFILPWHGIMKHYEVFSGATAKKIAARLDSNITVFRPPGTIVGRPYVLQQSFFFFSSRDLRGPWTDLREILPHSRKDVQFTNARPKIWGPAPKKFWQRKTR